jgi:hypothetical protein
MLLRDVEGDFIVQVHVGGQVRQVEPRCREAGLQLAAGQWRLAAGVSRGELCVTYNTEDGQGQHSPTPYKRCHTWRPGEGFWLMDLRGEEPVLLQLQRRGDKVEVSAGLADSNSLRTAATLVRPLPHRLKLGVYAQALEEGIAAEFSHFKLTRHR